MPRIIGQAQRHRPRIQRLANVIGERGEDIFKLAITNYEHFELPLFKPGFLGDKWPAVDFYVEMLGVRGSTPFFFAQVKSTNSPLDADAAALSVRASKDKCTNLFKLHVRLILLESTSQRDDHLFYLYIRGLIKEFIVSH
jgi:hypothetical protein